MQQNIQIAVLINKIGPDNGDCYQNCGCRPRLDYDDLDPGVK